jgi:DNA integrity scanning protein DisA with diadenylate cyclase activity
VYRTGNPVYNLSVLGYAHALEGNLDEAHEILKEVESEDIPGISKIYVALGDYDRALDVLDNAIMNRSFFIMYSIKQAPWFDPLRSNPRFDRIIEKMGLSDKQLN